MKFNLYYFSSPATFFPLATKLIPIFWILAAVFMIAGLWVGLVVAPIDFQQGEGYRIIFVHVPTSWLSMFLYLAMAFWAAIGLAFKTRLSAMMCRAIAPTGAIMAFLFLWYSHGSCYRSKKQEWWTKCRKDCFTMRFTWQRHKRMEIINGSTP